VTLDLAAPAVSAPVGRLLAAPSMSAHNTPADPDNVRPGPLEDVRVENDMLVARLPAHSFATVRLAVSG
jgi:alpha-N-arabinofuranosidase